MTVIVVHKVFTAVLAALLIVMPDMTGYQKPVFGIITPALLIIIQAV